MTSCKVRWKHPSDSCHRPNVPFFQPHTWDTRQLIVEKRVTEVAWGGKKVDANDFIYLTGGAKPFRAEACGLASLQGEFILFSGIYFKRVFRLA